MSKEAARPPMQFIPLSYLVDRLRYSRSGADTLREIRARLKAAPDAVRASSAERHWAKELARLRAALLGALGQVESCAGCASGHPEPFGRWPGGHCCGGHTLTLFTEEELGALKLSGTTLARLAASRFEHAGCVFRGPRGCSLSAADRPYLCVRFLCRDLERELSERGILPQIRGLQADLKTSFEHFVAARQARLDDEQFNEIIR